MQDDLSTIGVYKKVIQTFVEQDQSKLYHSAKNLTITIAIQAAKFLELVQLLTEQQAEATLAARPQAMTDQMVDILFELLLICTKYDIDFWQIFNQKMIKNVQKYPVARLSAADCVNEQSTINDYKRVAQGFIESCGWDRQHSAKSLAMNVVLEVSELLEQAAFMTDEQAEAKFASKPQEVTDEIVDVFFALLALCIKYDIDLSEAFSQKMMKNAQKYPLYHVTAVNK